MAETLGGQLHQRSPRVVIVGGGFAGAYTARELQKQAHGRVRIELIDRKNYFVFQPLLPEVVGGAVNALDCVTPLRQMLRRSTIRVADVRSVNFQRRQVEVVQGDMGDIVKVPYDHLVLAPGTVTNLSRFPGMEEHAYTVKEALDSFAVRNHVISCLERASLADDRDDRERLLTFVVAGGGFSGIEVLGELMELVERSLRFYPSIGRGEVRFVLVEYANRILPEVREDLARKAADILRERGAQLLLGTPLRSASGQAVEVGDGRLIPTATIIATVGNGPRRFVEDLPLPKDRGRIVTERDLRVKGFDDVWALGDAALIPLEDGFAPPTAQAAVREAKTCARNILRAVDGEETERFSYRSRGTLASLGGRRAVADMKGLHISGRLAWVLWRIAYVAMIPQSATRWRVGIEQLLDLFLPRSTVQSQQQYLPGMRKIRHRAGEVALKPRQLGDGMHIILEGCYEEVSEEGIRLLGPGDRFGEVSGVSGEPTDTLIQAREDSLCIVMARDDLRRLAEALAAAEEPAPLLGEQRRVGRQ